MGLCERISETPSMIMRTENAVAVVNTALSPAIKSPKGRRVMVGPAIGPASNTLMGLQSVSRDGHAGIQTNGKAYVVAHVAGLTPRFTAPECSGPHSTTRTRWTNSRKPGRDRCSERPRGGGQWLRPIFAANKQPSGKTL